MPQQDMSSRLGSSPAPSIDKVVKNNEGNQKVLPVTTATEAAYNKQTVDPSSLRK